MKKILTALMASAFALTIYAPSAMACGGHDKENKVAKEEKKADKKKSKKTAKKADKKKSKKKTADKNKG